MKGIKILTQNKGPKKGQRYVRIGKKKVFISPNISKYDLIKFLIERFAPVRRRKQTAVISTKAQPKQQYPVGPVEPVKAKQYAEEVVRMLHNEKVEEEKKHRHQVSEIERLGRHKLEDIERAYNMTGPNRVAVLRKRIARHRAELGVPYNPRATLAELEALNDLIPPTPIGFIPPTKKQRARLHRHIVRPPPVHVPAPPVHAEEEEELFGDLPQLVHVVQHPLIQEMGEQLAVVQKALVDMTVPELKTYLKGKGLSQQGLKADLLARAQAHQQQQAPPPPPPVQAEGEEGEEGEWEEGEEEPQGGVGSPQTGLNNEEITKVMKRFPDFLGVIPSDYVRHLVNKIKPHSRATFIMNLDKHGKPGSHWVAVYIDARPNGSQTVEYFNSLADPPTKQFMKDIKYVVKKLNPDSYLKFKENRIQTQSNKTMNCGYHSMKFLIDRYRNKQFPEASGFDDHVRGEKDIKSFISKFPGFKYL